MARKLDHICIPNTIQTKKLMPGKGSRTEKSLFEKGFWLEKVPRAEKGFLAKEIFGLERYPKLRNFCPGKVPGESSLPGKDFLGRKISAWERFLGKDLFLRKVSWADKSLPR